MQKCKVKEKPVARRVARVCVCGQQLDITSERSPLSVCRLCVCGRNREALA